MSQSPAVLYSQPKWPRIQASAQPLRSLTLAARRLARGFSDAAFEGVPRAFGVGLRGLGLAQEVAEVEEMLLAGAALGERDGLPFLNEFVGGQGRRLRISDWGFRIGAWLKCNPA